MNSPKRDRRRAVAGVWVAMFGMVMVLFVGLAIDTSFYVYTSQQLQNIADASSLAGAIVVRDGIAGDTRDPITIANDWAMATAAANKVADQSPADPLTAFALEPNYDNNLPNPDIEAGNWDRSTGVFTPYDPDNPPPPPGPFDPPLSNLPNAVRVVARKTATGTGNPPLSLLFGPIVGADTADVERNSVAMIGGGTGAGLIVLAPDGRCSLELGGDVDLIIDSAPGYNGDAGIHVNSETNCGACGHGAQTYILADVMDVVGTACFQRNAEMDVVIEEEQDYVLDPLRFLPDPYWDPAQDLGCVPCGRACDGGPNEDHGCVTDADCPPNAGDCIPVECPPLGICNFLTTCIDGDNIDQPCVDDSECPNGTCGTPACLGGLNAGMPCGSDTDCMPNDGDCTPVVCPALGTCSKTGITACQGGANDELMCTTDADCPGGDCLLSNTVTLDPGYYSGGIRITSTNTAVTCNPGVYVVDNVDAGPPSGLFVNGGDLTAHEVMFFVKGQGVVKLAGNGAVEITPSSDLNDPYWGISIFQARDNFSDAIIIGTSDMNLQGTYYFPVALLQVGGTSVALGNQVIAWNVLMHGNATYRIDYDGRFQLPGHDVFIVH